MSIPGVVHFWCQHKISIFIFSQLCAVTAEQGSLCHNRGSDKVLRRQTRKFSDHQPQTSASISVFARYFCSEPHVGFYLIYSRHDMINFDNALTTSSIPSFMCQTIETVKCKKPPFKPYTSMKHACL